MPRYWVMAAVESKPAELFDKVWQFDLAENVISIGWKELGDVSQMTREELANAVVTTYSDKPVQTKGLYTNMLWAFYHDMLPGDYVIARRGRKAFAGVGKIVTAAVYTPGRNPLVEHPGFLEVAWQDQPKINRSRALSFPCTRSRSFQRNSFTMLLRVLAHRLRCWKHILTWKTRASSCWRSTWRISLSATSQRFSKGSCASLRMRTVTTDSNMEPTLAQLTFSP